MKKIKFLLFVFAVVTLASCSTIYKSGQTPDDLYYAKRKNTEQHISRTEEKEYSYEDRQIRMAAYDARWRTLDERYDYDSRYNPYSYGYDYGYYYNPYYCPYPVYGSGITYTNPKNTTIRTTNLNTYNNTITTNTYIKGTGIKKTTAVRVYNSDNSETPRTTYETRTYDNRTYNPPANNNNNTNNSSDNRSNNVPAGSSVTRPAR